MAGFNKEYLKNHRLFRIRNKNIAVIFPLAAISVAIIVFWCLKLVGITVTSEALCELEEHTHISTCYSDGELVCLKPEHSHSSECFPENSVDVETSYDWKKTFEKVAMTNNVAENLVAVAGTQVGYTESLQNYEFDAYAEKHSYTRYGEWYGSPYGEWNTLFVSFCMDYANINNSESFISASAESMRCAWSEKNLYFSADEYSGSRGDVVFFDEDSDQKADRTAIVVHKNESVLVAIEGDVNGAVEDMVYKDFDDILGYGKTSRLYAADYIENSEEYSDRESVKVPEPSGEVNKYIPNITAEPAMFRMTKDTLQSGVSSSDALTRVTVVDDGITYTSNLEQELVNVAIKTKSGLELSSGSTVYLGESYVVSLGFSEINTGSEWIQFRHDENGYLTYQVPANLKYDPFDEWETISVKTENGTMSNVGEYYLDETGLLKVRFYKDENGVNFVEKYSNVEFTIDFNATVAELEAGGTTEIKFNDKLDLQLVVDGNATMDVSKSHGQYNPDDNTIDYTVRVDVTHGVVKGLVIDDQIWDSHYTLRDTILVTDLDGNIINPQPVVSDHPLYGNGADEGFRLSGFPDCSAGNGFLITYKTQIYDYLLSQEKIGVWNGVDASGSNAVDGNVYVWSEDWQEIQPEKMKKTGQQVVLEDKNGNKIPVIKWNVEIRKNNDDLQGTVVIDTLGDGLAYYKGEPIRIVRYDEWGNWLPDDYISWDKVTVNGSSMSFALPKGNSFAITYYTTYETPVGGDAVSYTNSVRATINGKVEQAGGSAEVVGFVPYVTKSARGDDGEFVYFTIEADVPATIKDVGGFYLTDFAQFWGYGSQDGVLYVENFPQEMIITATTAGGETITFQPYQEGGTIENTYIVVAPVKGEKKDRMHSFNVFFNTAVADIHSSKWILSEESKLKITYKIPFDAKTGIEWEGDLTGDLTVGDVLLDGHKLTNDAYLNYTPTTSGRGTASYDYAPKIDKKSLVNENGIIDYTVEFNNSIPGTNGEEGYMNKNIENMVFNDIFDARLEYVPGSLVVTAYSPQNKDMWIGKYRYTGTVTGNSIQANAKNFTFVAHNDAADINIKNKISGAATFKDYYQQLDSGGRFVFTYKLKVCDEYLYTTEYAQLYFDNAAEVTWDNGGSSGIAEEESEFYTGLIHKHVKQDDEKLDFQVHINRNALDIVEGQDTLIVRDTMTPNLSVYWDSIRLIYENSDGTWVDFNSSESKYKYTVAYDLETNAMLFEVPDGLHIIIDYTTLITESGYVAVKNSIEVGGKAHVSDVVDAHFQVSEHSGGASGSNNKITLLKQDGLSNAPLPNATFLLYGPMGDPDAVPPAGAYQNITDKDGKPLRLIGTYTTGDDGTVVIETQYLTRGGPYALVEHIAPAGYEILEEPVYFYYYDQDPDGVIQSVTTLIAVENFSGSFIIPATGGIGIYNMAKIGGALVAAPVLYSLIRRKRERRLTH